MAPGVDLELPEDETLWEASSEKEWKATLSSIQNPGRAPGLKAAWNFLAYGKGIDPFGADCAPWSTFSILAVIHLVINHMWYLMQTTQYLTVFAFDPEVEQKLRSLSDVSISTALGRCYEVLTSGRPESERSNDDPEGPMIFNCLALLRVGFVRTSIAGVALNQIVHLTEDEATRSKAITLVRPFGNPSVGFSSSSCTEDIPSTLSSPLSGTYSYQENRSIHVEYRTCDFWMGVR